MKYYVIINGNSSLDIQGLAIESLPNISKPLIRTTREEIDGRDGDIITKLGYSAYDKTLNIGLWGNYDINEVIAYFNEEGVITFSNEPDKYYKFHILNRIDFVNQLEKFKKASITIHCQPFKYKEQEAKVIEEEEHTTSGTSFNLSDTLEAPLLIDLKGNTSQTGTPTPSSPIPVNVVSGDNDIVVCGVNLEQEIEQGNINSSGVPYNDNTSIRSKYYDNVSPNTTYIVSKDGTAIGCNISQYDKNYTFISRTYYNSGSFTTSATTRYVKVQLAGATTDKIQLQLGNTASTYSPYNGTTYNIDLISKQLFNKNSVLANTILNSADGTTSSNNERTTSDWIEVKANTTYIFSNITDLLTNGRALCYYNSSKTFISSIDFRYYSGTTITTPNNAKYMRFCYVSSGDYANIMLNEGSTALPYENYWSIELNKIGTYQDYIYKENDKWYLHKETNKQRILSSSWNWSIKDASSGSKFYETSSFPTTIKKVNSNIDTFMCNYLQSVNLGGSLDLTNVIGIFNAGEDYKIRLKDITGNNLNITNLYNWLDNNEVYLYYAIQTPTNTEITYTPLIEQLNTLEQAQSYEGTTNINQVNNDLPFILDITYYTGDTSITITNDGNIYSKPLLELKGTGNINIYLNGIQVFVVSLNDEIIYIDTDKMEAYYQGTLKNRQVVGDYNNFKLQSGNNTIQVDGGYVEYLKITNYSRWV